MNEKYHGWKKECLNILRTKFDSENKKFKKDDVPFGEIEVLRENLELIKRRVGLEHVEILSVTHPDAVIKAGRYASLIKQTPPSPGCNLMLFP